MRQVGKELKLYRTVDVPETARKRYRVIKHWVQMTCLQHNNRTDRSFPLLSYVRPDISQAPVLMACLICTQCISSELKCL